VGAHANLAGHTSVGARTVIAPFASLGGQSRALRFAARGQNDVDARN
jgi:acyl-[acyl carrier protein]--UDP-N-acetylglucosamine O-acyltransferase